MLQCHLNLYKKAFLRMLELGSKFLISYFIGSIMGSMVMGRLRGGVDIRTMGSGNAGGTNALRTQGIAFALGVMIIDVGKGVLATALVPGLELPGVAEDPQVSRAWLTIACAAASVIGHVWPIWHGFRGGKGAATLVGTLVVLKSALIIPLLLIWAWMLVVSGYVGLATMTAAVSMPIYLVITRLPHDRELLIYCSVMAIYLVYSHRSNIRRMRDGSEPKNTRLMVFHKNRPSVDDDAK